MGVWNETKDDQKSNMLKVVKKWYSDIADVRLKHKLVVVMRDKLLISLNPLESRTISAQGMSNGRMDYQNPRSIQSC